jgi:radical SAM superfamily enzyme YgiQ (UPF0313 family)
MPRLAFVAMSGFRIREAEMLALGMRLPGLAARAAAIGSLPSLGLLTLAGLTPPDWEATWHECAGDIRAAAHSISQNRPTLVAISALTASILDAYALADLLREQGLRVVMGGLHVSTCAGEALAHCDAVVVGEGETVWHQVLEDARAGRLQPTYRAATPTNLAHAPLPRWDLLGERERPRYTLQTARGCPLACDFCGASRLLGPFREKPAANVAAELAAITARHPKACIELADDNTFAGKRDANELLSVLRQSGVRWFTECDWRIGERPDVLDRLAESGCVQVLVGVEPLALGADAYGGLGAKRAELSRVIDALQRVQDAGVAVIGCFVVGGDQDDEASIHTLGEWLLQSPLADVQITIQTPFPGTPLRARLEREGRLLPDRSWESCTLFDVAYQPARMSVPQLERAFRNVVAMVHTPSEHARRMDIRQRIWGRRYAEARR